MTLGFAMVSYSVGSGPILRMLWLWPCFGCALDLAMFFVWPCVCYALSLALFEIWVGPGAVLAMTLGFAMVSHYFGSGPVLGLLWRWPCFGLCSGAGHVSLPGLVFGMR